MAYPVRIIPEAVEASDGRSYDSGELTWRTEIPLMGLDETAVGHEGATFVGNITNIRREFIGDVAWLVGDLTYDSAEIAVEFERLATEERMTGVSADIAEVWEDTGLIDEFGMPIFERISAEVVGATQVPMPAFDEARIVVEPVDTIMASLRPGVAPEWFADPHLEGPTAFTVTAEGRVYGHLATWGTCHTGFDACVTPPEGTDYSYFHTGAVQLGAEQIPVGHVTMNTGHAAIQSHAVDAISHYDHTGACAADVVVGEDAHGIWVAGAAREGVDLDELRAASLSGDWRKVNGNMELVAALAVNVPGFPIPRTRISLAASGQIALVASGVVDPTPARLDELEERLVKVEQWTEISHQAPVEDDEDEVVVGDIPPVGRIAELLSR